MAATKDIASRSDIDLVLEAFYKRVFSDELIGPFFTKIAGLDFDKHLNKIADFWETILFGAAKYKGNPLQVHLKLNQKKTLKVEHFERWLSLFKQTMDEYFSGPMAEQAKTRANRMAEVIFNQVSSR